MIEGVTLNTQTEKREKKRKEKPEKKEYFQENIKHKEYVTRPRHFK